MSPKKTIRTCVLYSRISLATEESVSIRRQVEAGEAYASARGWKVVGTFVDEGVSATHNKPETRKGWSALLAAPERYDAVIVWKVDRLARRVIDFLNANEAVKARSAGIVAVEDPIDMTTAQGEAFAIMLAVFGQMEAAAIRDRVTAARNYLLRNGRHAGGVLPYGYRAVPNPNGAGLVIAHDPERILYVREMVRRTLDGNTIYSTLQWLQETGAPTPKSSKSGWIYSTVDRLMRHPLLAGMIPHNPGNTSSHERGDDVVRDRDGLPVVDESLAVLPVGQWRAMQARLATTPDGGRKQPHAMRRQTSGVLSGLMWCADPSHEEPQRMYRGTLGSKDRPRAAYYCKHCHQAISGVEDLILDAFLNRMGDQLRMTAVEEVVEGGTVQLREASVRLAELGTEIVNASTDRAAEIVAEMTRLKEIQDEARDQPAEVRYAPVADVRTFREDWESAESDEQRRAIVGEALDRVLIRRGGRGAKSEAARMARLTFEWMPAGQLEPDDDAAAAAWAGYSPGTRRAIV